MTMDAADFAAYHRPALEADEVRHNVILGVLARVVNEKPESFRCWTLGGRGACAIQSARKWSILLGNLNEPQCRKFAEDTAGLDYPA